MQEPKICYAIGDGARGGVTIAYAKDTDFDNNRMVWVSVAYCSEKDIFSKSIGRAKALFNWEDMQQVLVPARSGKDDASIVHNLRNMFWYSAP